MREILRTTIYILSANMRNVKLLTSLLLISYVLYVYVTPIELASEVYDLNISYGIIGLVCSDSFVLLVLFLAVLFAFSNLPAARPSPYYLIIRGGKVKWLLSHFLYIVIISTIMVIIVLVEIILFCRGRLYVGDSWGKIITGATYGQIPESFGITLEATPHALVEFSPLKAIIWSVSSIEVTFIIAGCITFVFNLLIRRGAGTVFNGLLAFMHLFCSFFPTFERYYFSPIDWCSIFCVDLTGYGGVPGVIYICIMRTIIVVSLLLFAIIGSVKVKDFVRKIEREQQ